MKLNKENESQGANYIKEAGRFKLKIISATEKMINSKRALDVSYQREDGAILVDSLFLTDAAQWRVLRLLKAAGFHSLSDGVDFAVDSEILGKEVDVDVKMKTGDKVDFAEIAEFHFDASLPPLFSDKVEEETLENDDDVW